MFRDALQTLPARLLRTEVITLVVAIAAILSGEVDTLPEAIGLGTVVSGYAVSRGIAKQGSAAPADAPRSRTRGMTP